MNVLFVTEIDQREQRLLFGVVVCVCAIMFSVIVTAVALIIYAKPNGSPLACVTDECLAARTYLVGLLNASVDTCTDFYGYVCGSWIARGRNGGSFHRDRVEASVARINEFLRSEETREGDATDFRLIRILYRECQRYASERSAPAALAATLETAREQLKWAEIRNAPSYNKLVELLVHTSLLAGFHTVLVLQLLTEDSDAVLRLSSGTSLLRKLTTTGDQRDLEETLRRTTLYEDHDLNKTLEMDDLVNAALDGDRKSSGTTEEGDIDGPIEKFLDDLVPDVNATGWIREILGVLSRFGENSFVAGGLVNTALYLASHLDAEILSLELSRSQLSPDPEDATRFCLALTQRTLAFSWPRLVATVLQVPGTQHVLETAFDQLKKVSHQATMLKWLSTPTRLAAQQRIRLVGLIATSRRMSSMAAAMNDGTSRYARLVNELTTRNDSSFMELYIKVMALVHGVRVRSPPTRAELEVPFWEQRGELAYSWITTSVMVPTLYQLAPYFYPIGVPAHFNYATVGALLATAIAEAVAPVISSPNETGSGHRRSDAWWTRGAMRKYRISAACFERMHSRLGLQRRLDGSGERQRHEMLLLAQGLRLAYDALVASFGKPVADKRGHAEAVARGPGRVFRPFLSDLLRRGPESQHGPAVSARHVSGGAAQHAGVWHGLRLRFQGGFHHAAMPALGEKKKKMTGRPEGTDPRRTPCV
ncbi:hypothetical protein MTO96_023586 [Rhipicephalus appendiculatus]